ncbi:MAG: ABC transporter ATP-binding protein [Bacillota bacterium]
MNVSPVIEVEDLAKHYGEVVALDGVTFSVSPGEIFGFLGPNGAGKTTTINCLTGLARPTAGKLAVLGLEYPHGLSRAQESIGVVPDESNLYPEMDGFENLVFCAALYGMPPKARERRARELLELFDLADVGSRPFGAYSRGMKRKLTIAAGLIHDPEVLFLDEPTTGIDVASARGIRRLLADLNSEGLTIFLTTHYIEEAERLCHRIAFLVAGKVVRIDTTDNLLAEADGSTSLTFVMDDDASTAARVLREAFPELIVSPSEGGRVSVTSETEMDLMPLMRTLDDAQIAVYEARIERPSLEDVFVRITGIEAGDMKEKERGNNA